jgi:hypothetical protein
MPIQEKSKSLKVILSQYQSDSFLCEMAVLLTYSSEGPIPFQPFHRLHSPLRQLFYLASLNLSSQNPNREEYDIARNEKQYNDWKDILSILDELDETYEQEFLNQEKLRDQFEVRKAQAVYPSFIDSFFTGPINYEEQVIERIEKYFENQNAQIESEFGLSISDFIKIYNILDEQLHRLLNKVFELRKIDECNSFWQEMSRTNTRPLLWKYTANDSVNELIKFMQDESEKLKVSATDLYEYYDSKKVDSFFEILSCNKKINNDFLLFTEENFLLTHPIYRLKDGRFLIFHVKQVIHAIYNLLFNFSTRNENVAQAFYKKRGVELEIKIEEVLKRFLGKDAIVIRDYKTKLGKGQDIQVIHKGVVLIVEAKASKKDTTKVNVTAAFNQVKSNFKEIFQKGFEQTDRIEQLFFDEREVDIFDKKGKLLLKIKTKNVYKVFSIIVTLEKFSQVQTDLSLLLELDDDKPFPYSICIDDLEVFLITMKREKCTFREFIHFIEQRIQFYGRLECRDELEICGQFFYQKKLIVPPGSDPIIIIGSNGDEIFEKYYEYGLGFDNEKNIDRKKSGKFKKWPNTNPILDINTSKLNEKDNQ